MVKILITAGLDGDEYAGVAAAKKLLTKKFKNVTIIPIVNKEGYKKGVSFNPLDYTFPKHVFPGKEKGSPTQRLMYRLATEYIYKCKVWIDLHSGARDEKLYPFIHIGQTRNAKLRQLTNMILQQFNNLPVRQAGETIILDKDGIWPFTKQLDKKGILYLRFEAGEKGKIEKKWVDTLLSWVQKVTNIIGHPESFDFSQDKLRRRTFSRILEYTSPAYYYWKPTHFRSPHLILHQPLGTLTTNRKRITLYAKAAGQLLWWKMAGNYVRGETLLGQAVIK